MPSRPIRFDAQPLLDISSYARRGPGRRDHLSPAEIERVARTVRRTPEVMIKVLSRGGQDLKAVRRHLDYLRDREEGELPSRPMMVSGSRALAWRGILPRTGISTFRSIGSVRTWTDEDATRRSSSTN